MHVLMGDERLVVYRVPAVFSVVNPFYPSSEPAEERAIRFLETGGNTWG